MMDSRGNLHQLEGPGGGQFASRAPVRPASPLADAAERLRARVRITWRDLLSSAHDGDGEPPQPQPSSATPPRRHSESHQPPAGSTDPVDLRSFIANVSIPSYSSAVAPVTIEIAGAGSGDEVAREYRAVDGQLFRQVWGVEDHSTGRIEPAVPAAAAWAPTEPGRSYELLPVPADEEWLREQAERATLHATSEDHAAALTHEHLSGFAAIDGDVWQATDAPVYLAPLLDDAPFTAPLAVTIEPAPDTTRAAAQLGYFHADDYDGAVDTMTATAAAVGAEIAPGQDVDEPPIRWLRELGLIGDEPAWRPGTPMDIEPSETLTEGSFRDRLAAFREQIVTIPGAVTGDVGSFLVVGDWKLDFAALTRQQQDEYRRYIVYGVEHGLI